MIEASSKFFAAMWRHSFSEREQGFVEFKDIEEDIMEILVDRMGECYIGQSAAVSLISVEMLLCMPLLLLLLLNRISFDRLSLNSNL